MKFQTIIAAICYISIVIILLAYIIYGLVFERNAIKNVDVYKPTKVGITINREGDSKIMVDNQQPECYY